MNARQNEDDEESTETPRHVHGLKPGIPYPKSVMRGAFVVQLRKAGPGTAGHLEGTVEEVDTGRQSYFHSGKELIGFLLECFSQIESSSRKETQDRDDHHL